MTKVRQDTHGLYVKGGGYLFRPIYPVGYKHLEKLYLPTRFKVNDDVKCCHRGGTSFGSVSFGSVDEETWYSHGRYFEFVNGKMKNIDTNNIFKPSYAFW